MNDRVFWKQVALDRMEKWEIDPDMIQQFCEEDKVPVYDVDSWRFFPPDEKQQSIIRQLESKHNGLVYFVIRQSIPVSRSTSFKMDAFLYIDAKTEKLRRKCSRIYDDYRVYSYVYNYDIPEYSEFGNIRVGQAFCGGLGRITCYPY